MILKRVLLITYTQTFARDIMRNVGNLDIKSYIDAYDYPNIRDAPRLTIQLDRLMNLVDESTD